VSWLRNLHERIRETDPFRADAALAAAFVVAAVVETLALDSHGDSVPITLVGAVLAQSSLAFRRRDPLLAAVLFAVPTALQAALGGYLTQEATVHFLVAMLLLYSIGRYAERRALWIAPPLVFAGSAVALSIEASLERAQ
jgi:hypothetical protein